MSHLWVPIGAGEAVVSLADALALERHKRRIAQAELAASQRAHRALCESLRRTAAAAGSDPDSCVRLVALWASELPEAFR